MHGTIDSEQHFIFHPPGLSGNSTLKAMSTQRIRAVLLFMSVAVLSSCPGQEWTRFRGPNGTGISAAKTIPSAWTEKDFNWKVAVPGEGYSSPVVWADKIFITSADAAQGRMFAICVNATDGRILWQKEFPFTAFPKHDLNSFASSSPAVDQQRVYFCLTTPEHCRLLAFNHAGEKKWEADVGPFKAQHGAGTSPIVYQDEVVLANDQDGESSLVALDAASGKIKWRTARKTAEAAYSTPFVYQSGGNKPALIFTSHAHGISAVDPEDGKVLWELDNVFDKRVVSSPLLAGGLVISACGSGGGGNYVVAVKPGDPAKERKPEMAYTIRKAAPYLPTSVCVGDLLFLWGDGGIVTCILAASGEVQWQERVDGKFYGSPVCVDGRLFCVSTSGEVVVLEAANKFKLLARNPLNEATESTPAVAGGRMYIHTSKHLLSIGGSKQAAAAD
jgi:outer membrane protein assembly factor BamB